MRCFYWLFYLLHASCLFHELFYIRLTCVFFPQVKRMDMEQKDCSLKVDKLLEKHSWIGAEKHLFGKGGTDYDFSSRNPRKSMEELEKLQAEQSGCVI